MKYSTIFFLNTNISGATEADVAIEMVHKITKNVILHTWETELCPHLRDPKHLKGLFHYCIYDPFMFCMSRGRQ